MFMAAAHCGQHETVAVGEGGDGVNISILSSRRINLAYSFDENRMARL
jgi:hypothetical protein